jgi:hypothetical protein
MSKQPLCPEFRSKLSSAHGERIAFFGAKDLNYLIQCTIHYINDTAFTPPPHDHDPLASFITTQYDNKDNKPQK